MTSAVNSENSIRYTRTAITLHWLVAALIVCAFSLGWIMTDLAVSPLRLRMFNWHKWVGVTILLLIIVRLVWRLTHRPPQMLPMPAWQRVSAKTLHAALYVLLLLQTFSGWIYSNASGYQVVYLGMLPLPNLVQKNKEMADVWMERHEFLGWCLFAAVSLHILAALKHQFIDGDSTLKRMWYK